MNTETKGGSECGRTAAPARSPPAQYDHNIKRVQKKGQEENRFLLWKIMDIFTDNIITKDILEFKNDFSNEEESGAVLPDCRSSTDAGIH